MRLTHNPVNGRIYFEGGDYSGLIGLDSGRNETYSYSIVDSTWKLEFPTCGPAGSIQPSHPDEVGWVYDTKRSIFWMLPGYMGEDPGDCPASTIVRWKIMTFDPVAREWKEPSVTTDQDLVGERSKFAQYDPKTDTIIRFYYDGASGASSKVFDIATNTWTKTVHRLDANGVNANNARLGEEYTAMDLENRYIYIISPTESRLYRYNMDTKELRFLTNTPISTTINPSGAPVPNNGVDITMPIWDSVNKVLLWPQIFDFSGIGMKFHVYHPNTNTWEISLPLNQPEGLEVRGNNAVFDPYQNVLLIMGGTGGQPPNPYIFLYRYGNGSGAPKDTAPPLPPTNLQVQ